MGDAIDNIYVNNVKLGNIAAGTGTNAAVNQGANIAAAFNAVSNQSGVTATFSTTTGAVSLTAADGRNISLIGTGKGADVANTGLTIGAGGAIAAAAAPTTFTALAAGDLTINGYDVGAVAAGTDALTKGTNVGNAINALTSKTGVAAAVDGTTGVITLTTGAGQAISISGSLTNRGATATATGFSADQMGASATASTNATITRG